MCVCVCVCVCVFPTSRWIFAHIAKWVPCHLLINSLSFTERPDPQKPWTQNSMEISHEQQQGLLSGYVMPPQYGAIVIHTVQFTSVNTGHTTLDSKDTIKSIEKQRDEVLRGILMLHLNSNPLSLFSSGFPPKPFVTLKQRSVRSWLFLGPSWHQLSPGVTISINLSLVYTRASDTILSHRLTTDGDLWGKTWLPEVALSSRRQNCLNQECERLLLSEKINGGGEGGSWGRIWRLHEYPTYSNS